MQPDLKPVSLPRLAAGGRQRGFALVEVLVTLMVFSIGLAGYAAMQTQSLRESVDTQQRSLALWRSQELIDRIRANPDAVDDYLAALEDGGDNQYDCSSAPAAACADTSAASAVACTAAELAAYDVWDVMCGGDEAVSETLVGLATNLVCNDADLADADACSPGSSYSINMQWTSHAARADKLTSDTAEIEEELPEGEVLGEGEEPPTRTVNLLEQTLATEFRP